MLQEHYLTRPQYNQQVNQPLPTAADIQQPQEPPAAPYFTSWLRPQILTAMGLHHGVSPSVAEYRAYYGGLKIRTTLDLKLQQAADQAISSELPTGESLPGASMVAIDNKTGEVRAMVGGPIVGGQEDYSQYPFNLATQGHRQPGSSFKPFTLAMALQSGGYGPDSIIDSAPQDFIVPNSGGKEHFIVHNFGNTYSGPITLAAATDISDNSVYAQVGIHTGTKKIATFARRAGIRSPVSHNYAMILGGLNVGVSPLDMAHAYETFAEGGRRVYDNGLGAPHEGPTGIAQIYCPAVCPQKNMVDHPAYERVLPASVAAVVHELLTGVVQHGTGTEAGITGVDVAGKTGTTTNYADAWFVGWTPQLTTAVWVGYPNKLVPMTSAYNGAPVEGGTYPAIIWHNFMVQALEILAAENPTKSHSRTTTGTTTDTTSAPSSSSGSAGSSSATATATTPTTGGGATPNGGGATQNGGGGGTRAAQPVAAAAPRAAQPVAAAAPRAEHLVAVERALPEVVAVAAPRAEHLVAVERALPEVVAVAAPRAEARVAPASAAADEPDRTVRRYARESAGRDRCRLPTAENRHSSSVALVIPIRLLAAISGSRHAGGRRAITTGPTDRSQPLSTSSIPSAWVSLPGPEHRSSSRSTPRRARISSIPSTGSSARISTAAPTPGRSHTAFRQAWIP